MPDLPSLLRLAQSAASAAICVVEKDLGRYRRVDEDRKRDVKVLADGKLESIIVERLLDNSPHPVLSEETGLFEGSHGDTTYRWIVDPLDGSCNFSREIPINCISIGFWQGTEPLLGVIHDFNRHEVFLGIVDQGAWLNGNPAATSHVTRKSNAILCTGFPVSTDFSVKPLQAFVRAVREYKKIRILGSAALSLAYVACGRADAYMENDIKLWDVAAGIALVKAAGGIVKYDPTSEENTLGVKASNPYLLDRS